LTLSLFKCRVKMNGNARIPSPYWYVYTWELVKGEWVEGARFRGPPSVPVRNHITVARILLSPTWPHDRNQQLILQESHTGVPIRDDETLQEMINRRNMVDIMLRE
jgi:hypothetical protein